MPYRPKLWPLWLALLGACATQPSITKLVGGRQIATRSVDPSAYEHAARAMLYEEQSRWQDAANELERALVFDGDSPELHARLAEMLLRLGKVDEAAAAAKKSLKIAPTSSGLVANAHVQRAHGDIAGAVASLRKATYEVDFQASDDDAESVYLELAQAQIELLDLPAARATLEILCGAQPESWTGWMRLMAIAWATGEIAKAKSHLSEALSAEPNHVEALAALAWIHAAEGRNDDAKRGFRDALDRSDGALEIASALARFLVGLGADKEAEQVAEDFAISYASLDAENLAGRVELERSARRFAHGLALLARAGELGIPEDAKTRIPLLRATLLKDLGKPDDALAVLMKVGKDSPLYFDARVRAADLLRQSGKSDEAIRTVEDAAAAAPGERDSIEVEAAVAVALVEDKRGNPADGVARLRKALEREPDDVRLSMTLAAIEERRGRWKDALGVAERVIGKNPGSVEALNFWGFVAADHDHALDLALRRIEAAAALDPGSGGLLDSLGWAHFRRRDLGKAASFLEQAARLEPSDPEIQWHLGSLYAERQQGDLARTAFRKALGSAPDDRLRRKVEDSLARLGESKTAKK